MPHATALTGVLINRPGHAVKR